MSCTTSIRQLQRVGTGEPARELLRAVPLQLRLQPLDRVEDAYDLAHVHCARVVRQLLDEQATQQREQLMRGGTDGRRRLRDAVALDRALDRVGERVGRDGEVDRLATARHEHTVLTLRPQSAERPGHDLPHRARRHPVRHPAASDRRRTVPSFHRAG